MADVERNTWSSGTTVLSCGDDIDVQPNLTSAPTSPIHHTEIATGEKKMSTNLGVKDAKMVDGDGDSSMNEFLEQQVCRQMELIQLLMKRNQEQEKRQELMKEEFKQRQVYLKELVKNQQVVKGRRQNNYKIGQVQTGMLSKYKDLKRNGAGRIKIRLNQKQLGQIYRKSLEHSREESLQDALRWKHDHLIDDPVLEVEDHLKDEPNPEESQLKQEQMDEELRRIQEQWRNELIKDKVKFQRARKVEESRFSSDCQTIGQKLDTTVNDKDEERKRDAEKLASAMARRERLRQELLMRQIGKRNSSSEKTEPSIDEEDDLNDRRRRRNSDEDPDDKRARFLERNRAAATRCRNKRKQWIVNLESKADELNNTNVKLQNEVTTLRNEVAQLKQLLLAHKDCPVTLMQRKAAQALQEAQTAAQAAPVQILSGTGAADLVEEPEVMEVTTVANMEQPTIISVQAIPTNPAKQMSGPST